MFVCCYCLFIYFCLFCFCGVFPPTSGSFLRRFAIDTMHALPKCAEWWQTLFQILTWNNILYTGGTGYVHLSRNITVIHEWMLSSIPVRFSKPVFGLAGFFFGCCWSMLCLCEITWSGSPHIHNTLDAKSPKHSRSCVKQPVASAQFKDMLFWLQI